MLITATKTSTFKDVAASGRGGKKKELSWRIKKFLWSLSL